MRLLLIFSRAFTRSFVRSLTTDGMLSSAHPGKYVFFIMSNMSQMKILNKSGSIIEGTPDNFFPHELRKDSTFHCTGNHIIFFQTSWKCVEKIALEFDLSCIIRKDDIVLFPENTILFLRRKMKNDLSRKKIHGNTIFYSNILKRW